MTRWLAHCEADLAAFFIVASLIVMSLACGTPPKTAAGVERELCAARADFKAAEVIVPALEPKPGSARERLELAEDAYCSTDAGAR